MKISEPKLPSNKKFGAFFFIVFFFVTIFFYIKNGTLTVYIFVFLSLITLGITILKADILLPLNKLWMRFGIMLGRFISPIILGIIFFTLFMPIAIFFKLTGRDQLSLKYSKVSSYWIKKDTTKRDKPFINQY